MQSRPTILNILIAAAAVLALAAAPASGTVEIVDGCGDTDSHVMGEELAHPTPPATDVDTVDLRGRYAADGARSLTGLEVEIVVCGDALAVASGESITVGWYAPADGLEECDRSTVGVTVSRSVEDGSWSGSLARRCVVDSDDCWPPLGSDACSSTSSSELVSVDLPAEALVIDGHSFTVVLERAELPDEAAGFLVEGDVFTGLWVYGSSFANAHVGTGADDGDGGDGVWVSLVERGEGTDHVLGGDRA